MTDGFFAVIPAGGSGTRLWPLSRAGKPKFLLPLPGPQTMIQETVARMRPVCATDKILIVTGQTHAGEVARQLPELGSEQLIVEPLPRGSGPAIGLATAIACQRDPEAIVGSFAADHVVTQPAVFQAAVRAAITTAHDGYLVTIGITPSYPETGYGYICAGRELQRIEGLTVRAVDEFKEKPDLETASHYVASGEYLWNASMFVWQAKTLLEEMRRYLPELAEALQTLAAAWDTPDRQQAMNAIWPTVEDVTIDQGILERSDRVAVVPGTFGWTDLGDWHGFGSVAGGNSQDNVLLGTDVVARDVHRSIVLGDGRLIALLGVEDLVVVDTEDALLVCHRSRAQEVRSIVSDLKLRGSTHLI